MDSTGCVDIQIPNVGRTLAVGNPGLLHAPRAAVLNSRQGKFPNASAAWIKATLELVRELVRRGSAVVSSVGMFTWELVTWKAGALGAKLIVVVSDVPRHMVSRIAGDIVRDFGLDAARTLFLFPEDAPTTQRPFHNLPKRDCWIVALADTLHPVSIRPGGNLARIIELSLATAGRVQDTFTVFYAKAPRRSFRPKMLAMAPEAEKLRWDYLTHWTKATHDSWPGERKAEFYAAFECGEEGYPRSAFHTLRRIIKERRLRASKRLIRGEEELVSLTACPPWELVRLVRWRPSLVRWTFEPYGIALNRQKLESLGARPVIYGEDHQYRLLEDRDKPFFQACGQGANDWRVEKEWRYKGDLDLSLFSQEDATVFVFTREEADLLKTETRFPVVSWHDIPKRLAL